MPIESQSPLAKMHAILGPKLYALESISLVGLVMKKNLISRLRSLKDTHGQDLIEYALMAGFVAVAAGAIMPGVASSISTIFSKVASIMTASATQGS
jgi:Flp pilus assembly pilin Flp